MEHGFLLMDKPTGVTSFGALRSLDRQFQFSRRGIKYGHGGTLDPDASGLLVVALGRSTRLLRLFLGSDKRYVAQFCLGRRTTTDDATGETVEEKPWDVVTRAQVEGALAGFRGTIMQVPPDFSAIHVNGKRAYELARAGRPVEIAAREVTVYSIELTEFDVPRSPVISLDIECSGGTYIRSIARDLGAAIGTCAHMCSLRRTRSCRFDIAQAHPLDEILASSSLESMLLPDHVALAHLPAHILSVRQTRDLMAGRFVDLSSLVPGVYRIQCEDDPTVQAIVEAGEKIVITRINT